jgi:hypothetical protein
MPAPYKKSAPLLRAGNEPVTAAYEARDLVRDHLITSLTLCDDVLARCEQMKLASRKP